MNHYFLCISEVCTEELVRPIFCIISPVNSQHLYVIHGFQKYNADYALHRKYLDPVTSTYIHSFTLLENLTLLFLSAN